MASKNIRDVKLNVDAKQLGTAARNADKLNKALASTIETVKGSSRSFTSISNSMKDMASSVKAVNRAISSSTSTTKGLENYKTKVGEARTALMNLRHEADNTLKAVKSLNTALNNGGGMVNMRDDLLDLKDGIQKVVEEMQDMNKNMRLNNIYTIDMEESLGKLAQRTKQVRESSRGASSGIERLVDAMTGGKVRGDSLNQSLRGLAGQGRSQARSFSELAFKMNPLTSAYASIAINVYAAAEAFRVLSEAANLDRLLSQTATFSAAVSGINVKGLARNMMDLSGGALSLKEALSFSTKGTAFNFTTEQLEKLTIGARKASIALGRDFNDSMDRVLRGISKQEIELFDELGVVTRLTPAFEAYAKSVGKSVDELSDYERQLALTNEVQRQLDQKFSGIDIATTSWERLGKATQNALDTTLISLSKSLAPIADFTSNIIELVGSTTKSKATIADLTESKLVFTEALKKGEEGLGSAMVALGNYAAAAEKGAQSSVELARAEKAAKEQAEQLEVAVYSVATALTFLATRKAFSILGGFFGTIGLGGKRLSRIGKIVGKVSKRAGVAAAAFKGLRLAAVGVAAAMSGLLVACIPVAIALGVAAGAVYYFREELNELTGGLLEFLPGMESLKKSREAKEALEETNKAIKEMRRSLVSAGVAIDHLTPDQILEMGTAFQAFNRDIVDVSKDLQSFAIQAAKIESPFQDLIDFAKPLQISSITASIQEMEQVTSKVKEEFKAFAKEFNLNPNITSAEQLVAQLTQVGNKIESMPHNIILFETNSTLQGLESSHSMLGKIAIIQDALNGMSSISSNLDKEKQKELTRQLEILRKQLDIQSQKEQIESVRTSMAVLERKQTEWNYDKYVEESKLLEQKLHREQKILEVVNSTSSSTEAERRHQQSIVDALNIRLAKQKEIDALTRIAESKAADSAMFQANRYEEDQRGSLGGRRIDEVTNLTNDRIAAQKAYDAALARFNVEASSRSEAANMIANAELEKLGVDLKVAEIREQAAAFREVAEAAKLVAASTPGMTGLQSEFMNTYSTIASTIANVQELAASGTEATLKDFASSITSVGSMAANIFSELTNGIVSDIDAQIAAEKARDGKSQESLAKIRQLERKKIKEQEKSKIAQTAMATSLSIMNAYAELGPIAGSFAAAGLAALGVLQVNNIKKASAGQLAALDPGTGTDLSVTVGSRANTVDLAQRASIGEAAYLRGDQGVGSNANSFIPGRSGGGSVIVGERGPERITPLQPINVQPASKSGGDAPMQLSLGGVNIHAIDSQSFAETAEQHAEALFVSFQKAASARGINLDRISAK